MTGRVRPVSTVFGLLGEDVGAQRPPVAGEPAVRLPRPRAEVDRRGGRRLPLNPKDAGVLSAYHKAALAALRDITGKDTAPTAEAWRKLLKIDAKPRD